MDRAQLRSGEKPASRGWCNAGVGSGVTCLSRGAHAGVAHDARHTPALPLGDGEPHSTRGRRPRRGERHRLHDSTVHAARRAPWRLARLHVPRDADTYAPEPPCCRYRRHRAACARMPTHCTYTARVLASAVPYVPRTVAPQVPCVARRAAQLDKPAGPHTPASRGGGQSGGRGRGRGRRRRGGRARGRRHPGGAGRFVDGGAGRTQDPRLSRGGSRACRHVTCAWHAYICLVCACHLYVCVRVRVCMCSALLQAHTHAVQAWPILGARARTGCLEHVTVQLELSDGRATLSGTFVDPGPLLDDPVGRAMLFASMWKAAAQRLRPTARPASARSSAGQPPGSASLGQLAADMVC